MSSYYTSQSSISNWHDCDVNNSHVIPPRWVKHYERRAYEDILLINIQPSIAVLGAILNVILILIVAFDKSMHSLTNVYLVNLAVSDLLFLISYSLVTLIGALISPFSHNWQFLGPAGCLIFNTIYFGTYHFSLFIVTFITFERYLAVCHPLAHRKVNSKSRTMKLVVLCWFLALLTTSVFMLFKGYAKITCVSFPPGYGHDGEVNLRRTWCTKFKIVNTFKGLHVLPFLLTIPYLICLTGNIVMCICIVYRLGHRHITGASKEVAASDKIRNQVSRMLVINSIMFFTFHLPDKFWECYVAANLLGMPVDAIPVLYHNALENTGKLCLFFNSATNPIIYGISNRKYRLAFKKMLMAMFTKTNVSKLPESKTPKLETSVSNK